MTPLPPPATGQTRCYNEKGDEIPCEGSGQDGQHRAGVPWPSPRFDVQELAVLDRVTGLMWTLDAAPSEFPLSWEEALDFIRGFNMEKGAGREDWRLPNRNELFSLISHVHTNPCLGPDAPFQGVFPGYYWTSTTCARLPNQAWYVHLGGARLFKGMKHGSYMVWPVRDGGEGAVRLPRTGYRACWNGRGESIPCDGAGQDGGIRAGAAWPDPRFEASDETVLDRLTGLAWMRRADLTKGPVAWDEALAAVRSLNEGRFDGAEGWRLPNIRELASLTDMGRHSPALPSGHPFRGVSDAYWSSTTSIYDPSYAWTLYLMDGPVGVGHKPRPEFHVWAVRDAAA
jgi:hypothetical protein